MSSWYGRKKNLEGKALQQTRLELQCSVVGEHKHDLLSRCRNSVP